MAQRNTRSMGMAWYGGVGGRHCVHLCEKMDDGSEGKYDKKIMRTQKNIAKIIYFIADGSINRGLPELTKWPPRAQVERWWNATTCVCAAHLKVGISVPRPTRNWLTWT